MSVLNNGRWVHCSKCGIIVDTSIHMQCPLCESKLTQVKEEEAMRTISAIRLSQIHKELGNEKTNEVLFEEARETGSKDTEREGGSE